MLKNTSHAVKEALAGGASPFLAFEEATLRSELEALGVEQSLLGELLGRAMSESSETFHDNAPAEAISSQSTLVARRAGNILSQLALGVLFDYPDPAEGLVTIGTVAEIRFGRGTPDSLLVTGLSRHAPSLLHTAPVTRDLDVVTARSPLGLSVIGLGAGDIASYTTEDGRNHSAEIISVQQLDPAYLAATQI